VTDAVDTLDSFRAYKATGDRALRNQIVEDHRWIAVSCARRFRDRGEPLDDLIQVGMLGLVKAVERFDPENGTPFAGYAVPTVTGEIRRHFRDATWAVHVPRRMKEVSQLLPAATERLRERIGRHPNLEELAAELRVPVDDVISALEASAAYRTSTLAPVRAGEQGGGFEPGSDDVELARAEARLAVEKLLAALPPRERTILTLRFFEEKSQAEIAEVVGTSQVHVSRLIRAALAALREHVEDAGGIEGLDPANVLAAKGGSES
jgi:RNA polymerase sigma-B factor